MQNELTYTYDPSFGAVNVTKTSANLTHNLPRDLSAVNRKNHDMTTRKGVPLVYHCKLTVSNSSTLRTVGAGVITAPQNWIYRNAAVKLHYAREAMFKNAGIRKSERGRYDKTVRYLWSSATETYQLPAFGEVGATYTNIGEWDESIVAIDEDTDLRVSLFPPSLVNEEAAISATQFGLAHAYMNSRSAVPEDDLEDQQTSAPHSIIRSMFNVEDATDDEITDIAEDNQDKTPYDDDAIGGTFTTQVISDISYGSSPLANTVLYFDAPFGLFDLRLSFTPSGTLIQGADLAGGNVENPSAIQMFKVCSDLDGVVSYNIEVLGISEMQG